MFYENEVDIHLNPKIGADWRNGDSRNMLSHRARTNNTIWREHFTAAQVESVMWVAAVKVQYSDGVLAYTLGPRNDETCRELLALCSIEIHEKVIGSFIEGYMFY